MMRTEDDLRAAMPTVPNEDSLRRLSALIHELATAEPIESPHSSRREPKRRMPAGVGAGVAAVLALSVVVSAVAVVSSHERRPNSVGGSVRLTPAQLRPMWRFTVDPVPGYTITRFASGRSGPTQIDQGAIVTAAKGSASGYVSVVIAATEPFYAARAARGTALRVG